MRTINFYHSSNGRCPVEDFLDGLSDKHAQKVTWVLRLISKFDRVPEQYFKKLSSIDDIWEIRIQFAGMSYRLLGFFDGSALIVLTNAFAKKRQTTPKQEIDLAIARRNDYLKRKN
jgi:phage-related protein